MELSLSSHCLFYEESLWNKHLKDGFSLQVPLPKENKETKERKEVVINKYTLAELKKFWDKRM